MTGSAPAEDLHLDLDRTELDIWTQCLAEAWEELPDEEFEPKTGITWPAAQAIRGHLRVRAEETTGETVPLSLPVPTLRALLRCLDEAMAGLGLEEFHTRTGHDWEQGVRTRSRLAGLLGE